MNRKKNILFVTEFSQLSTGFSTYMRYILPYLHSTGKYNITELSLYIDKNNPQINYVPWNVIPNMPDPENQEQQKLFNSTPGNQFGWWKIDEAALKTRADYIAVISDPWMAPEQIIRSPFRRHFKFVYMPTIDGSPQKEEWLDSYKEADILLTYSLWAKNLLEKHTNNQIKVFDVASPGSDINIFKPIVDKNKVKSEMGLRNDTFIINTVMRNQPRKLFPDLFKTFSRFLDICKENNRNDLAEKTFLHCHTSFPDVGWDLNKELLNYKVGHKVLFTYLCDSCNQFYFNFFADAVDVCRKCHNHTSHMPNTLRGVTREDLAKIMGISDLYIQFSVCLPENQEILTKDGWKYIQDITTNDLVWSHTGNWRKVIKTLKTPNRNIFEVKVDSNIDVLQCTIDHPIYGIKKLDFNIDSKDSTRKILGRKISQNEFIPELNFCELENYQKGDLVAFPINDEIKDLEVIDISRFANNECIIEKDLIKTTYNTSGNVYKRFINVDEDFCKLIGIFAADGTTSSNNSIKITQNLKESENIDWLNKTLSNISGKNTANYPYKGRKALDIVLSSMIFNKMFYEFCNSGNNKKLPDWAMLLPLNKQKSILQGLFMGDGYYSRNTSVYVTISKTLAYQIKQLLERNRINYNLHIDYRNKSKDKKNRKPQYRFEVPGHISSGKFISKRSSTNSLYYKNYILKKIKSITKINYDKDLYNLEVEKDNSYTTKLCSVHNCEGYGMSINDAKSCGVPVLAVDYSAMSEQCYNGGALPIKVERFLQEPNNFTGQLRALPDIEDAAQKLFKLISDDDLRLKMSKEARETVVNNYSWDQVAKIWENVFDNTEMVKTEDKWESNPKIISGNIQIPENLSNEQFIDWCFRYILKQPFEIRSQLGQKFLSSLDAGYEIVQENGQQKRMPVDRNIIMQNIINRLHKQNEYEQIRFNTVHNIVMKNNQIVTTEI